MLLGAKGNFMLQYCGHWGKLAASSGALSGNHGATIVCWSLVQLGVSASLMTLPTKIYPDHVELVTFQCT